MKRKIVTIDEAKCNGCGLCVAACHEGALQLIDGKAKLISDAYCDGLGDCLPECPMDAITIEEREAAAFDEEAVKKHMASNKKASDHPAAPAFGCPGSRARTIVSQVAPAPANDAAESARIPSQLRQWPCQIQLVPVQAPYFDDAHLLIAADCTAYAYGDLHREFMQDKITLIGCPKLDHADYAEKLTAILNTHTIKSLTVLRMEVPCCGGIVQAVMEALQNSNRMIPWRVVTISTDGRILEDTK